MSSSEPIRLPEGEYAKYLASQAAEIADEKARVRDTHWRAVFGTALTILAIFGYVNISSIKDDIERRVANKLPLEVKQYIDNNRAMIVGDSVSSLKSDLEARIALLQLVIAASELRGDGFTNEARSTVVDLLQKVSINKDLVHGPQFAKSLENVVDAFLQADLDTYIDDIDEKLRPIVSRKSGIVASMLQHYGLRVLGAAAPTDLDIAKLNYYAATLTDSFHSPEKSAPFMLGLAYIKAGMKRDAIGEALFRDATYWTPDEKGIFIRLSKILRDGEFYEVRTGATDRVVMLMQEVFKEYKAEFEKLASTPASKAAEKSAGLQDALQISVPAGGKQDNPMSENEETSTKPKPAETRFP